MPKQDSNFLYSLIQKQKIYMLLNLPQLEYHTYENICWVCDLHASLCIIRCTYKDRCEVSNKKHDADALEDALARGSEHFYQWKRKTLDEVIHL